MRPVVICHMLSPLDGRLLTEPWAPEGSPARKALLDEYQRLHDAFAADAWLAGTTTMEDFATGGPAAGASAVKAPERPWHVADANAKRFAVTIDRHARLHWSSPTADEGHVVVVLAASVDDGHLAELAAAGVSYLVMPSDEIDLAAMLEQLNRRLGIRKLLLEGGAKINGAFLKAGLVDEISLLLWPAIDGRTGGPAIFETGAESLGPRLALALSSATPLASGAVHLQYRVRARPDR
jgi:riboflavin biosynthesis pyrimidine reductase